MVTARSVIAVMQRQAYRASFTPGMASMRRSLEAHCLQRTPCSLHAAHGQRAQVKDDFKEIVLSSRQDEFYKRHMYSNFGDLGSAVQVLAIHS